MSMNVTASQDVVEILILAIRQYSAFAQKEGAIPIVEHCAGLIGILEESIRNRKGGAALANINNLQTMILVMGKTIDELVTFHEMCQNALEIKKAHIN